MLTRSLRALIVPITIAAASACASDSVTGPTADELGVEPVELSLDAMDRGDAVPRAEDRSVPMLQRLLHEAVAKVRAESGDVAARRLLAPLRTILSQARDARLAGNIVKARRLLHEANLVAARIVLRAFGPQVVDRLDAAVTTGLSALLQRIAEIEAAGGDATRLARAATAVEQLQERAASVAERDVHVRAILLLAHALDLLHRVGG